MFEKRSAAAWLKKRETSLLGIIVFLIVIVSLRAPNFLRPGNLYDILNDSAILFMVAIGQFMVILTGGIDLSVASSIALSGMGVALLNQYFPGIPMIPMFLIAMVFGFILGSFNGLLVSAGRIPPIIATLGTLSIYRGLVFVLSGGEWVSAHEMSPAFRNFPHSGPLGITNLLLIAIVTVAFFAYFINYTRTGREIYGVGGNLTASRFVGIDIRKIQYLVFALSGLITGMAGMLWVSRYASAQNETAVGFELQTIAACVIGGVSTNGGSGAVTGVLLGAVFLGIVNNALTLTNISPFWQMAIQGFVIIAAIIANTLAENRNRQVTVRRSAA